MNLSSFQDIPSCSVLLKQPSVLILPSGSHLLDSVLLHFSKSLCRVLSPQPRARDPRVPYSVDSLHIRHWDSVANLGVLSWKSTLEHSGSSCSTVWDCVTNDHLSLTAEQYIAFRRLQATGKRRETWVERKMATEDLESMPRTHMAALNCL